MADFTGLSALKLLVNSIDDTYFSPRFSQSGDEGQGRSEAISEKETTRLERWVSYLDTNLRRYIYFEKSPKIYAS